jgi:hypothetical protein
LDGRADLATRFANTVANFFTAFFLSDSSFLAEKTVPKTEVCSCRNFNSVLLRNKLKEFPYNKTN